MKKLLIFLILFTLTFTNCKKIIRPGRKPRKISKIIPYKSNSIYFEEERLNVNYLYVENYLKKDSDDIIFFLHGIYRTEFEWVEEKGFGELFYQVINKNPQLKSYTVIAISLGGAYLFINEAPAPFHVDLETFFLNKIIPYFKNKLSKNGNVYLIGHSLGGFNSLMVSLRNPDKIKAIAIISPYVAPISPFSPQFEQKGRELKMPRTQILMLKNMLTRAFETPSKWLAYNPFVLIKKQQQFPYISISGAQNDLPGFADSIEDFSQELEKYNIAYYYCKSAGDHRTTCMNIYYNFLKQISNY